MDYDAQYGKYLKLFEEELNQVFSSLNKDAPQLIKDVMIYAVNGGGKRIRPVLCLATVDMLKGDVKSALPFALALEFIHSYSLVHDDLPAMDNDDFRRGKFSTHKKFGEAFGILAGDALLNFAFEICLSYSEPNEKNWHAMKILAEYAGYSGMIAGQALDLLFQGSNADEKALYSVYYNKTSKLLMAPLLIASVLCGGKYFEELKNFGYNLGIMFQITDDILDVEGSLSSIGKTPNKDEKEDKLTSVKIFGIKGAKLKAKEHYKKATDALENIPNNTFILKLTEKICARKS